MKIRMKATLPGSIDGICVSTYSEGVEYDLTATAGERALSAAFIGAGFAEEVPERAAPVPDVIQSEVEQVELPPVESHPQPASKTAKKK